MTSSWPAADAAQQLPVRALIVRIENVAIGGAEIQLLDVVRIRCERNDRAARRAHLPPCLSWRNCRRTHSDCCDDCRLKPFSVHMKPFSQSAHALTIPECTESEAEKLLLQRTDFGLVTVRPCTSTANRASPRFRVQPTSICVPQLAGKRTEGNFLPAHGLYTRDTYLR